MSSVATTPIPLTRGLFAWIDVADLPLVAGRLWHAVLCNKHWYAATSDKDGRRIYMHRLLGTGEMIDHADGDGLNNTRKNLRPCNRAQNSANRRLPKSATGLRGVFHARQGFVGRIRADGEQIYTGFFTSANHAYASVAAIARKLHGDFSQYEEPRSAND